MLTSKDLAELLAEKTSGETSEVAKQTTGRGLRQFSAANNVANYANYAKLLPDGSPTTSQTSHVSQSRESVAKPIQKPFLAISQTSQSGVLPARFSVDAVDAARALIKSSPLTGEMRESRLADLARAPQLAQFWLIVWGTKSIDLPIDFGKIQRS
jgi:hypothetical protein